MTTQELYHQLNLMPILQIHMLRVAGVAGEICKGWKQDNLNKELTVKSCLLHDLGNMAKFKLDQNLPNIDPLSNEETNYWKQIQHQFWTKYGTNAHEATYSICEEIGATDVIPILKAEADLYFSSPTLEKLEQSSPEITIAMYADLRVMPHGVVSLQERVNDLCTRYNTDPQTLTWTHQFETYLQTQTTTPLTKISENSVEKLFETLKHIQVS